MYQVIARKYRPQTFADVVNQEHVKTTLENAIAQNRIAHGYIFSGQRGTGKTTIARILARCLNCVKGPTATPCGVCASCLEITAGGTVDVIEIDAASNRGINEMRELRENVRYQPARDRYKVFIVDEAHQITNEAFNALLKTIEEPPPWVVFVLCTTEAHKIPATIASRCQHFSFRSRGFRRPDRRAWRGSASRKASRPIRKRWPCWPQAGEGSVRDSLSALDQAIACCGAKLDAAEVRALLGAFSLESLEQVTRRWPTGDSRRMLEVVDELERNGHNLQHFSRELSRYFRNLLVARIAGADTRLVAASARRSARSWPHIAGAVLRRGPHALPAALARSFPRPAILAAAALPPGDRAAAAGAGRPAAADRTGAGGSVASGGRAAAPRAPRRRLAPPRRAPPAARRLAPPRLGPSPFELDRAKKAGTRRRNRSRSSAGALRSEREAPPMTAGDPRERLHAWLPEQG